MIKKGYKDNFHTLLAAAGDGNLALLECQDKKTKKKVFVVTALSHEGKEIVLVPIARMFDGNPYDELNPPNPEGGFFTDGGK